MKLFADRAFVAINGFEALYVKSADLESSESLQRVETMTRNRRTAGYRYGNKSVQLSLELEIERDKAQLDMALAKDTDDIQVVFICGGERYSAVGVRQSSMGVRGSVGDASKSIKLEALDLVNENGTSVNASISLG